MKGTIGRPTRRTVTRAATRARTVLVSVLLLTGARATIAQEVPAPDTVQKAGPPVRQHRGFWLSAGGGGGWQDDLRGAAVYIRLGGTPSENILLGGEVLTWFRGDEDALQRINVTVSALYYPFFGKGSATGLFLKGGFGVGTTGDGFTTGVGTTLGLGFDFRIGRNLYVTPNVDFLIQFFENSTDTEFVITLGLGFH